MSDSIESPKQRKIIHVDMDSFYASVEMRDRPELRGKPVAVGGSPEGRGVVAAASYEARKFGVRSAMASAKAQRLCPQLIMVRPDFSKYKAESRRVRAIFERFVDPAKIEPLSLDEAYLDLTGSPARGNSASLIATDIRDAIRLETGLTASAGIAPNKFLAKVASEWNKPDGQKTITPADAAAFVQALPIEKIWGVGRVTAGKMRAMGLRTCGDLQKLSLSDLAERFGSWSVDLYAYARGQDDRPVRSDRTRRSLSVENTFSQDLLTLPACLAELDSLYQDWDERIQRARISPSWQEIRGIVIKLKFNDFRSMTRERACNHYPTLQDFRELLIKAYAVRSDPVRLIGLGVRLERNAKKEDAVQENVPQLTFRFID